MSDQNDNPDKKPNSEQPSADKPQAEKPQARPVEIKGASPQKPATRPQKVAQDQSAQKPAGSQNKSQGQNSQGKNPKGQKRPPNRKRPPKKKINPTQQSLIGIFVFALGFALVVAVLYLTYTKFYKVSTVDTGAPAQVGSQLKDGAQEPNNRDAVKNIDKASLDNMIGQWTARYGYLTAYLTVTDQNLFQITLFMDPDGFERRYTSGSVNYDDKEGLLTMQPSYERWPEPETGVLKTLTRNKFSVVTLFSKKDGSVIWVPYESNGGRGSVHPLFQHMQRDEGFIRWTKMKK